MNARSARWLYSDFDIVRLFELKRDRNDGRRYVSVPGEFRVGTVRTLFGLSGLGGVPGNLYDVTADGQKFIAVQDLEHTSTVPLTIVINWPVEIQK